MTTTVLTFVRGEEKQEEERRINFCLAHFKMSKS